MSKRSSGKRKAAEANLPSSSASSGTAASLASTMLEWLPSDATMKNGDAKKLLKAFDLVRAELQHRTNLMAANSVETGAKNDVLFLGGTVAMPHDIFRGILEFVPRCDVVHKASLVSKAWLAVARDPMLWTTLDGHCGLLEQSSTVTNMTKLLGLLSQSRQFSSLKTLIPPDKVQVRSKCFEQIAKACPLLETLDIGFSPWSNMKPDDTALQNLPALFPHLKEIRLDMYKVTNAGLVGFFERMGERLVSFRIADSYNCSDQLSDNTLSSVLPRHCPNLERFAYHQWMGSNNRISARGIIGMLDGCPKLKNLALVKCDALVRTETVCEHILEQDTIKLDRLYVVDDRLNSDLCARLEEKIESCELIDPAVHNARVAECRRARRVHINW